MLTYDIAQENLRGEVGGTTINLRAVSGGGRGSTVNPSGTPGQVGVASWDTKRKAKGKSRGGPLPPGMYIVQKPAKHPHLGRSAFLVQTLTAILHVDPVSAALSVTDRSGFFIHGRGKLGSDGCIVPIQGFDRLMTLLDKHAPVLLDVVNPGVLTDRLPPRIPPNVA